MRVQFRRITPGFYTTTALGYKIRLRKIQDVGGHHWEADSPNTNFPLTIGFKKADVVRQVNEYLQSLVQK